MSSVSVIIPCYNYAHFLRDCVDSVLSQTGVEIHVLVIDDSSTDNTAEVASELAAKNPCLEYRRHSENWGHIATYNEGLAWAGGDYTVLISADDMLTPGSLMRAAQLMDAHPEVGFVYGRCVKFSSSQPLPRLRLPSAPFDWEICKGIDWIETVCEAGTTWITSPEVMVRTSLQHELGGYIPELPHTGDMEMWLRFAAHASVGKIPAADQGLYRLHSQNMHRRQFSKAFQDIQERRAAFDTFFHAYQNLIPGWERYQRKADRSLASDALWAVCQALYHREAGQASVKELIKYATIRYRGKFLSLEYGGVYLNLINRFLESVRRRLKVNPRAKELQIV